MLAGNADRDRVVDVLRAGFAEGRLTQEEFTERVAQAYKSRTYGELATLTADLPTGPIPAQLSPAVQPAQPVQLATPVRPGWPWPGWPALRRQDEGLLAPSLTGLALTAVVVFVLAAFVTGVAVWMHTHGQPDVVPIPRTHLEPFYQNNTHPMG